MVEVHTRVTVIVDLVGSRRHGDRAWVHRVFTQALSAVNDAVPAEQPLEPTLGDEAQARYRTVEEALRATLLLRLELPEELDARAGIGVGAVQHLGTGVVGLLQDGPGWWAARDAIDEAKARETARDRTLRTWFVVAPDAPADPDRPDQAYVDAFLLLRDEIVTGMPVRSRRLLRGVLDGRTQAELAEREGISPSAVSQNLRRSGAYAVLHAHALLLQGAVAGPDPQ
ncbi:SatD family protein [Aeromicrobium sp.]|uniref:SatD family protein n=1 Tax=Aeromicrobium sp. TaxID=1871063 RepID=UPI0040335BB4